MDRSVEMNTDATHGNPAVIGRGRLEAFSDGVLAILITIMVLEMKVPQGDDWPSLLQMAPHLLSYVLSFVYLGIYWNNHHHMLQTVHRVDGGILWANLHLLFWLSLVPLVTNWVGLHHQAHVPTSLYGVVLLMSAIAYDLLQWTIITAQGKNSLLRKAVGRDVKGKASMVLYLGAIVLAHYSPWMADAIYVLVALIWLVPDRRIERILDARSAHP
jgi:uncharacterized membrane protein